MITRFTVDIVSKDGFRRTLWADHDMVIVPPIGSSFGFDKNYGVTVEVKSVYVYPTCDPAVYVTGRALVYDTTSEASEVYGAAQSFGWNPLSS